jgi:hypothetical protein|tara:strand:- start:3572 stop:4783 length:1212 start_codon:yes stop_codon:yes gene_type:complete
MANRFEFESPINILLNETIPRFVTAQLERESGERMALDEISFRREEGRLNRLQRTKEAESAREDSAEQARLDRTLKIQQQNRLDEMFAMQKRLSREKSRSENDNSILESLKVLSPSKFLERTNTMTLSTAVGDQALGDMRDLATSKLDNATSFLVKLPSLGLNKRDEFLIRKKLESDGEIDWDLLEDASNRKMALSNLPLDQQFEITMIQEEMKALYEERGMAKLSKDNKTSQVSSIDNEINILSNKASSILTGRKKEDGSIPDITSISDPSSLKVGDKVRGTDGKILIVQTSGKDPDIVAEADFVKNKDANLSVGSINTISKGIVPSGPHIGKKITPNLVKSLGQLRFNKTKKGEKPPENTLWLDELAAQLGLNDWSSLLSKKGLSMIRDMGKEKRVFDFGF